MGKMSTQPRLVAALICGNEEERIERCVTSLQKICNEIVVVRAIGSLKPDATLDIAEGLGCRVSEYFNSPLCASWPHVDDFAAARNDAFEIAYSLIEDGDWVMWADCDDVLADNMVEPHLKMLREVNPEVHWVLTDYVITEQGKRAPRERFFRKDSAWWWRPVHENAHPPSGEDGEPLPRKILLRRDLEIEHRPALGRRPSNDRNLRILAHHDRMSSHFKFYLHYERMIVGDTENALRYGAESLALRDLDAVHRYEVLINLSNLSNGTPALQLARRAKALDLNRREAYAIEASILLDCGEPEVALKVIEEMERIPVPSFPQWTHKKEWYGWKALKLRAWCLRELGDAQGAFAVDQAIIDKAQGTRISLLHATRGRPIAAIQNMTLWLQRANNPDRVEHIFAVDHDDETAATLNRFGGVVQTDPGYSVGAWNLAAQNCTGEILIQLSDDIEPPPGWDDMVDSRLDTGAAQVLRTSDGYRTDELITMAIITRKYYEQHGLFDPRFKNQFSDADFTVRAAKAGAIINGRDIALVHHHPAFENRALDATHRRVADPVERERAEKLYNEINNEINNTTK